MRGSDRVDSILVFGATGCIPQYSAYFACGGSLSRNPLIWHPFKFAEDCGEWPLHTVSMSMCVAVSFSMHAVHRGLSVMPRL